MYFEEHKLTLNAYKYNFICIQKSLKKIQSTLNPIIIEKELKIENDVDFSWVRLDDGLGWSEKLENIESKLFILFILRKLWLLQNIPLFKLHTTVCLSPTSLIL